METTKIRNIIEAAILAGILAGINWWNQKKAKLSWQQLEELMPIIVSLNKNGYEAFMSIADDDLRQKCSVIVDGREYDYYDILNGKVPKKNLFQDKSPEGIIYYPERDFSIGEDGGNEKIAISSGEANVSVSEGWEEYFLAYEKLFKNKPAMNFIHGLKFDDVYKKFCCKRERMIEFSLLQYLWLIKNSYKNISQWILYPLVEGMRFENPLCQKYNTGNSPYGGCYGCPLRANVEVKDIQETTTVHWMLKKELFPFADYMISVIYGIAVNFGFYELRMEERKAVIGPCAFENSMWEFWLRSVESGKPDTRYLKVIAKKIASEISSPSEELDKLLEAKSEILLSCIE